jgi:hypothetical protein
MSTSFPPIIHMFSTARFRRACCVVLWLSYSAAAAIAQQPPDATLYRIFLRDGSTLVSYGEYARVGDRIVVSLILGGTPAAPDVQLLSIPSETVDWDKTDAYAESARAARYAATRGPDDYAMLNSAVATALNDIAATRDPDRKVAMAAEARTNVTRWAADHFGYRADGVSRLAGLFDDAIAEARAAGGGRNFELSLVANMAAPPAVPLLPPPTRQESVEQAMRAATLAPDAAERTSLLRAIQRVLADAGPDAAWAEPLRARVAMSIAVEERTDRAYAALARTSLVRADRSARAADVTGVERAVRRALREDDRLGQRRPQEMASLLAMMDAKLDAARRLRLARDSYAAREVSLQRYRRLLAEPLATIAASRGPLDEIRRLAGPAPIRVARLATIMEAAGREIQSLTPPAEAAAAHGLLVNAVQLAARAAETRQRAVASGSMQTAWEASSAAAGALMLLDRAADDLKALGNRPSAVDHRE